MGELGIGQSIVNRYFLQKEIGDGGMGKIYLAEDQQLARRVAIKTIRQELKDNQEVRKRIERECKLHATLGVHPNIVALHDKIEQDGDIFLIMEYVQGEDLATLLKRYAQQGKKFSAKEARQIITQLLQALRHIHNNGILHRDIKPSNIMLVRQEDSTFTAKLMDFGIAAAENSDATQITNLTTGGPGTPAYMSPERIDHEAFGETAPPSDLYAAGVILYELLVGTPPFRGTLTEVFTAHLTKEVDLKLLPDSLNGEWAGVIKKSLQKESSKRFQNANEFLEALNFTVESRGISATNDLTEARTLLATEEQREAIEAAKIQANYKKENGSKKLLLAAVIVLLLLLTAGGGIYFYLQRGEKSSPQTAGEKKEAQKKPQTESTAASIPSSAGVPQAGEKSSSLNQKNGTESIQKREEKLRQKAGTAATQKQNPTAEQSSSVPLSSLQEGKAVDSYDPYTGQDYVTPSTRKTEGNGASSIFAQYRQPEREAEQPEPEPQQTVSQSSKKKTGKKVSQSASKPKITKKKRSKSKSSKKQNDGWQTIEDRTTAK